MHSLKDLWYSAMLIYHDIMRDWCEQQGNPRGWKHRERVRFYSTKIMQRRGA